LTINQGSRYEGCQEWGPIQFSLEDADGVTAAVLALGLIVGYVVHSLFASMKADKISLGWSPATLSEWNVDTAWVDILKEKDPKAHAEKLLDDLKKKDRNNRADGEKLNEEQAKALEEVNAIKSRLESIRDEGGSRIEQFEIQHGPFSLVMARLADIRGYYDRLNNTQLTFHCRKEFLLNVRDGLTENEITKAMRKDDSGVFQGDPYGQSLKTTQAELDALTEFGIEYNEDIMTNWLNIKPKDD